MNYELLPYQKEGRDWLLKVESGILGDNVGLGKTLQALSAIESTKAQKILIFCPAILKLQWQSEISRFFPEASIQIITGDKAERAKLWQSDAKYIIANYELLLRDFSLIDSRIWSYIVADEITRLKTANSKTSKLIKKLKAHRRIGLTATVISNRIENCWSQFDFVRPGALGNYWNFLFRYCVKNAWGGIQYYRNLPELNKRIQPYFLKRTKEEVLPELPEKVYSDVPVELSSEERKLYELTKREMLLDIPKGWIDKIADPTTMSLAPVKTLRLRQCCNSGELLGSMVKSSKMEALQAVVESLGGQKCIVFTEFSTMADIIERDLDAKVLKITGETSHPQRAKIVEQFNNSDEYQVLVGTSAINYGLNLGSAGVIVHFDIPWELEKIEQREGRISGLRQQARADQSILIFRIIGVKTVDEYIARKLLNKQELSDKVLVAELLQEV